MQSGISPYSLICAFMAIIVLLIIYLSFSIRIVHEDKRLSVYRLGRFIGDKGPGLVILIPIIDRGILKDIGAQSSDIPSVTQGYIPAETRTTVFTDGKVFFQGKEWDAISQSPIPAGEKVRIVRTILEVMRD